MTVTTSSSRAPAGSGAPLTRGTDSQPTASSGVASSTTPARSRAAAAAAAGSATSVTTMLSARGAAEVAAAPGSASSAGAALTARQPAGPRSPGRRGLVVTSRATGTPSASGTRRSGVLRQCDAAGARGHHPALVQRPVARVDLDVQVVADVGHQRDAGRVGVGRGLTDELGPGLLEGGHADRADEPDDHATDLRER